MKKALTFGTISFIIAVLLSACNSNFSITKRHFNNGYYVDNGRDKHSTFVFKEKGELVATGSRNAPKVNSGTNDPSVSNSTSTTNTIAVKEVEKVQGKTISNSERLSGSKSKIQFFKYPNSRIESTFSELKRSGSLREDGEGLSLFWIVILIILILWVLGVISAGFAIGSIINLLLLAALILLILWLLRIV